MSASGPIDSQMAMMQLDQQQMIQKKLDMDRMNELLSARPDKKEKLRDACEGFESIFIQKLWDQMRKNVQKSGYLHSREEHMYQGMYDAEFSKKMTEAGGIGLADMLYEQLSQRLGESSRTTSPRNDPRLPIVPAASSLAGLGGQTFTLEKEQNGIALDKSNIRPLYEDHSAAGPAAAAQVPAEAGLAGFDESLAAEVTATATPQSAPAAELDFEVLSHALLAEELASDEVSAPASATPQVPTEPVLSPEEAALIEAALRQNMAEAGRITTAQAPLSVQRHNARFGTALATDTANPADSAAVSDINKLPRS